MSRAASRSPGQAARGVSTVLDVALFLLLVSVAVGLLYAAPRAGDPQSDPDVAAETATTLATTTTTVRYAPAGSADAPERPVRGTVAEHLAAAAVANARIDGRPLREAPAYHEGVRDVTRRTLADVGDGTRIQVRAVWEPLPGADAGGEVVVGPSPPPDADVHAATVEVPVGAARESGVGAADWTAAAGGWPNDTAAPSSGYGSGTGADAAPDPGGTEGSIAGASVAAPTNLTLVAVAERGDCGDVSAAIARRIVGAAFPPATTENALRAGGPLRDRTVRRYRTMAAATDLSPDRVPVRDAPRGTSAARRSNVLLVDALGAELEPFACDYESATAAASAADPGSVTVVVRTWSS